MNTPCDREGGQVGAAGEVVGISHEHEDHGKHLGYAVMLDEPGLAYFVLPDGLRREGG